MSLARKFFSRRVTLPGNTATSFASLMRSAPATTDNPVWGQNSDGSISNDSFWGDGASVTPASQTMYVGNSSGVSAVNSASTYIGIPVAATVKFPLQDYFPGIVDAEQIYLYSVNSQDLDLVFQGRQ